MNFQAVDALSDSRQWNFDDADAAAVGAAFDAVKIEGDLAIDVFRDEKGAPGRIVHYEIAGEPDLVIAHPLIEVEILPAGQWGDRAARVFRLILQRIVPRAEKAVMHRRGQADRAVNMVPVGTDLPLAVDAEPGAGVGPRQRVRDGGTTLGGSLGVFGCVARFKRLPAFRKALAQGGDLLRGCREFTGGLLPGVPHLVEFPAQGGVFLL